MAEEAIARLLEQAQAAHHEYEESELQGVYDDEWPAWYAQYVIEHGLTEEVSQPITFDGLGEFLKESYARYVQSDRKLSWQAFTAAEIRETYG